jgi:hypothetical protein
MELIGAGDLVTVATGGPEIDGIVFDVPSDSKAVVAMMDRERGPVLRTVQRETLTERTEEGPDDRALRLLVRRTPAAVRAGGPNAGGGVRGRAGHARASSHRTTGK